MASALRPERTIVPFALGERGLSLVEAVVATVITVIAVLGLAHTFGMGRGFIERFAIGRHALAVAQARMDALGVQPASTSPDLTLGVHPALPLPFNHGGQQVGTEHWRVTPYPDPSAFGIKEVTVVVAWTQGTEQDSIRITRLVIP